MTQLYGIKIRLSPNQKQNLARAYHKREAITLRLGKDSLSGNDALNVPATVVKQWKKNIQLQKGMDIKLSKSNIRKQVGGSLLTTILTLGKTLAPTIGKTVGLSALAGLASEGASQIVKKISGKGQLGGFLIPKNKIDRLIANKHLLTDRQKKDIVDALQSGGKLVLKPNKSQYGGFLGALLASIGIPLAIDAIKKMTGGAPRMGGPARDGRGAPRLGRPLKDGRGAPRLGRPLASNIGIYQPPPPFVGTWEKMRTGGGKKKKKNLENQKKQEMDYCWEKTVHSKTYLF